MGQDKKTPPQTDDKHRIERAVERDSLTAKIQFLESQLAEKNKKNEKLIEVSKDLSEANRNLASANSELAKANHDLSEANEKLADANFKLSHLDSKKKDSKEH